MAITGAFVDLQGNGTGGLWVGDKTERFGAARFNDLRAALNLSGSGVFQRSVPIGGSSTVGLRYAGVIDAVDAVDFTIDNTSSFVSASDIVVPIIVKVRVEDATIAVTPRIYNVTLDAEATTTGGAPCVATDEDYNGTDQQQTLLLALQTGVNVYRLQFTATDSTFQFWGQGWRSLYIA